MGEERKGRKRRRRRKEIEKIEVKLKTLYSGFVSTDNS